MNYEEDVKKVYPNAYCCETGFITYSYQIFDNKSWEELSGVFEDEADAWKSTYERLTTNL